MVKLLRFGIIGTGVGASFSAQAVRMVGGGIARLMAVTSRREERAKRFAERWGLASWYTDYRKMLEEADIDSVIICTPHYLHCPMALEAARAQRHVLVDKPMAISLREADEMIRVAEKAGVKLGVILQGRFDPVARRIRRAIDEGRFGRLILGEAVVEWFRTQEYYDGSPWRGAWATEGGGALINQAIHTVDLLRWFMGPVDRLWAQMDTVAHEIEVEDVAAAVVRFESGAMGVIQGSTAVYPGLPTRLEIHGTKGTAIVEGEALKRWSMAGEEEVAEAGVKEGLRSWARPELVPVTNHASLIEDFVLSVLEDRDPYVSGIEGRKSLELILAIYKSARTGDVIEFPLRE
ncbi:TPA: Gfo/Idh/MocA family oxidoreductase [Candidatus Bathyarchaeota archaeon]|nr:Gfo/Idh/MocA family oxidoreductase [Candidatus Bathyarchaeota archaeon]